MPNLRRPAAKLVPPKEYAAKYGLHRNTVYRWIRLGLINYQEWRLPQRHRFLIDPYEQPPVLKPGPRR